MLLSSIFSRFLSYLSLTLHFYSLNLLSFSSWSYNLPLEVHYSTLTSYSFIPHSGVESILELKTYLAADRRAKNLAIRRTHGFIPLLSFPAHSLLTKPQPLICIHEGNTEEETTVTSSLNEISEK
jgi:hypothetical protein